MSISKKTSKKSVVPRSRGRTDRSAPPLVPTTVSRPSLLVGGSDAQFRELINGLLTLTVRLELLRDHLAEQLGVTGPQYSLLMAVGRLGGHDGISVGRVARALHVTSAFVAAESNRLAKAGLLEKRADVADRRSVLLYLSPVGVARLAELGPAIHGINDQIFGKLSRSEFDMLTQLVGGLLKNASVVLHKVSGPKDDDERYPLGS